MLLGGTVESLKRSLAPVISSILGVGQPVPYQTCDVEPAVASAIAGGSGAGAAEQPIGDPASEAEGMKADQPVEVVVSIPEDGWPTTGNTDRSTAPVA